MKELGDKLIASGVNLSDKELLLYILDGLGPEYDAVVANLVATSSQKTFQEAQFLLHKHEIRLERQSNSFTNPHDQLAFALLAAKQSSIDSPVSAQNNNNNVPQESFKPDLNTQFVQNGDFVNQLTFSGFINCGSSQGQFQNRSNESPQALLAAKMLTVQFVQGCAPLSFSHDYPSHGGANFSQSPAYYQQPQQSVLFGPYHQTAMFQLEAPGSNVAKTTQNNNHSVLQNNIPIATPQVLADQTWYVDSRAADHMTTEPTNLVVKDNYQGGSQVQVGNGQTVPVSHIGESFLASTFCPKLLHFKKMLCVLHIAKNLLSISQITRDNDVVVEFYSNHCVIKDKATKRVLIQGLLKDGLYQLQLYFPTTVSLNDEQAASVFLSQASNVSSDDLASTLKNKVTEAPAVSATTSSESSCIGYNNSDVRNSKTKLWHAWGIHKIRL
ncbi:uncharacterized protein LOC116140047 [Pistacia vera]|uniref:uncharacterized protein LOC116140047 n=1 Tax=Pistacia vera TaxID=55513 RepID=UPI0012636F5A|nr:uncharacterized protein LOC116140047 [Pistacia vera]